MMSVFNTGNTILLVARVAEKNDLIPANALSLPPGEDETLSLGTLGAPGSRYYIVKNDSDREKAATGL